MSLGHWCRWRWFYTRSSSERDNAISQYGYVDEGIAFWSPVIATGTETPFFRLYKPGNGDHFYTTSIAERDNAIAQWRQVMGATDPAQAKPGTLRSAYGFSIERNGSVRWKFHDRRGPPGRMPRANSRHRMPALSRGVKPPVYTGLRR